MHYLVYRTTHLPSGRYYIGRHITQDMNDLYFGSGKLIKQLLHKHPRNEFRKDVIHQCETIEEMVDKEIEEIEKVFSDDF